ncbi:hypothetical protein [Paracoccus sp. SCSIO 75233]|uniref:hypothetical protein n=1 Tax=Paracoccus sp. SCSIO 75233 TaxID=3017782 RepID=UPI0022F098F9|nr:hypothetical protein [Paracoccus sp. SCSIO 75233]WBU54423.1 hypothetical protein PAF12_06205 [Paracoccus sp. SCSIO 75233]
MRAPVRTFSGGVMLIGGGAVIAEDMALARSYAPVLVAADGGPDAAPSLGAMPSHTTKRGLERRNGVTA